MRTFKRAMRVGLAVCLAVMMAACQTRIPDAALQLTHESLEQRQLQTRRFDTTDQENLLSASAAVIQDLGFNLDESEAKVGLIVASKDRDATEAGQVVGAILVAAIFGVSTPVDTKQKIRVSLVVRPYGEDAKSSAVRVTFQRVVWNSENRISKMETLDDLKLYQEFFSKLSKSVFLEAHNI